MVENVKMFGIVYFLEIFYIVRNIEMLKKFEISEIFRHMIKNLQIFDQSLIKLTIVKKLICMKV